MNEACEYLFCDIMRDATSTTGWADPLSISLATVDPQWENGRALFWALDSSIINAPNF